MSNISETGRHETGGETEMVGHVGQEMLSDPLLGSQGHEASAAETQDIEPLAIGRASDVQPGGRQRELRELVRGHS